MRDESTAQYVCEVSFENDENIWELVLDHCGVVYVLFNATEMGLFK